MQRNRGLKLASLALIVGLVLSGCAKTEEVDEATDHAGRVESIDGTTRTRVRLTEEAARRLDIQTAPVREVALAVAGTTTAAAAATRVMPFAAVLYEPDGAAFTYTNPEPFVYVRQPIAVTSIKGDDAFLSDGPAVGTQVVTVGAAELSGIETSGFEE